MSDQKLMKDAEYIKTVPVRMEFSTTVREALRVLWAALLGRRVRIVASADFFRDFP